VLFKLDHKSVLLLVVAAVVVDSFSSSSSSTCVVEKVASVVVVSFSGDDVGLDEREGLDEFSNVIDASKVMLGANCSLSVPDCVGIVVLESEAVDGRRVDGDGAELRGFGINVGIKLDDDIVGTSSSTLISV
jgi:hypothetical protein